MICDFKIKDLEVAGGWMHGAGQGLGKTVVTSLEFCHEVAVVSLG